MTAQNQNQVVVWNMADPASTAKVSQQSGVPVEVLNQMAANMNNVTFKDM